MSENIPPAVSSKPSHSLLFLDHQSSSHQTQWLFCRILRSDWTGWSQPLFQKQPPSSLCVFNRCKRIVHTVHAIFLNYFWQNKTKLHSAACGEALLLNPNCHQYFILKFSQIVLKAYNFGSKIQIHSMTNYNISTYATVYSAGERNWCKM